MDKLNVMSSHSTKESRRKSSLKKNEISDSSGQKELDSTTSRGPKRKTARFDEENIKKTYRPTDKEYGFDKIEEPKTPYERSEPAVDPTLLKDRLLTIAQDSCDEDSDSQRPGASGIRNSDQSEVSNTQSVLSTGSFEEKRKKHIQAEFIVAKQASMTDCDDPSQESCRTKK